MPACTQSTRPRRYRHTPIVAVGVWVVASCLSFPSHANVECTSDEEAVIKCEPMFLEPLNSRLRPSGAARCMENSAICGSLPDDFVGTLG